MLSRPVTNITPFTLLDYPQHSACILWYAGCNMRCVYCYNPEIVLGKGKLDFSTVLSFLKNRTGLLDAVVFSGGECTMHKGIANQIEEVKSMGFAVKVDTNGSNPGLIKHLLEHHQIDYVALDFKAMPHKFLKITQSGLFASFLETLKILIDSDIAFEVRTTYHSELLSEKDIRQMVAFLETNNYCGNYYIQYFRNGVDTIEKLDWSSANLSGSLSTEKITVVFR